MHRATGKASGLGVAILASCSWLAACASQPKAQGPAVPTPPSAGASTPATKGGPASKTDTGAEASAPSKTDAGAAAPASSGTDSKAGAPAGTGIDKGASAAPDGTAAEGAPETAAQTPDEQKDDLDRNLQASLTAFDAMLLKEQQEAAARRAEHGGGAAAGAGGEGEGSGEGEAGGAGASGSGAASAGSTTSATGASGARMPREGGREVGSEPEGTPSAGANDASRVPEDVGDGRDDDVVARQLREAAMAEEDPAIREKLWEEYRRYKRGES
jgi:ribosomal protein L15